MVEVIEHYSNYQHSCYDEGLFWVFLGGAAGDMSHHSVINDCIYLSIVCRNLSHVKLGVPRPPKWRSQIWITSHRKFKQRKCVRMWATCSRSGCWFVRSTMMAAPWSMRSTTQVPILNNWTRYVGCKLKFLAFGPFLFVSVIRHAEKPCM